MIPLVSRSSGLQVLCLGAHPDDIEIGCGATLLGLGQRHDVRLVLLTGTEERQAEARAAAAAFAPGSTVDLFDLPDGHLPAHWNAVKRILESVAGCCRPNIIFAPQPTDSHQDHRLLAELVPTVWRDALILGYEIPKWDGDLGRLTHYVPAAPETARRKVELLTKSYPSQVARDWWDDETFLGLMRLRGIECRSRYAEAFTVGKAVLSF
ncbi:MAG TPA: PIG-L family deacetylase [Mycobacteriales bacterium]|nr:PIG-L family deacetylase [Mycobacteriales bacterium]